MKKVVIVGGGGGVSRLLGAFRAYDAQLTAVISMADSGGSTGLLRKEYGVGPVGDFRKALGALAGGELYREMLESRFSDGPFAGHPLGNILLAKAQLRLGSLERAIEEVSFIVGAQGEVLPVTPAGVELVARLSDGRVIRGEKQIDQREGSNLSAISSVWLEPEADLNPAVKRTFAHADVIILGPGDFYTSLIPNFLVRGFVDAYNASKATKIYVGALMTKNGETHQYTASTFLSKATEYLNGARIDQAFFNSALPDESVLARYALRQSYPVVIDRDLQFSGRIHVAELLDSKSAFPLDATKSLARQVSQLCGISRRDGSLQNI